MTEKEFVISPELEEYIERLSIYLLGKPVNFEEINDPNIIALEMNRRENTKTTVISLLTALENSGISDVDMEILINCAVLGNFKVACRNIGEYTYKCNTAIAYTQPKSLEYSSRCQRYLTALRYYENVNLMAEERSEHIEALRKSGKPTFSFAGQIKKVDVKKI